MKHLNGLQLAIPVTKGNNFEISLLIGVDYDWEFVGNQIVQGEGPITMQSKLGYLLSGPLTLPATPLVNTNVLHVSIPTEENTDSSLWIAELTDITQPSAD